MRKILALSLALLMLAGLCACGKKSESSKTSETASSSKAVETTTAKPASPDSADVAPEAKLDGKLNFIVLEDRDPSVLRGVTLTGNRAGGETINARVPATETIRDIFELNEYVGVTLDSDKTTGITLWVFNHADDQKIYETAAFSEELPGFAQVCELKRDTENPENTVWGEFYLNPDDCKAGYYDFVFVSDGKAIATILTRFYNAEELIGKTEAQLEKLMIER